MNEEEKTAWAAFWVGVVLSAILTTTSWAVGDMIWANDRDKIMTECTKAHTYESCLAVYRLSLQAPTLQLKKSDAP